MGVKEMENDDKIMDILYSLFSVFIILFELIVFQFDFRSLLIAVILVLPIIADFFYKDKHRSILMPKEAFHKAKKIAYSLCILSIMEVLLQFATGKIHRPHHVVGNCFFLPIFLFFTMNYFRMIDDEYSFLENLYRDHIDDIKRFTVLMMQMCIIFIYLFNSSYDNLLILQVTRIFSIIIQSIYAYLLLVCFIYLIILVFQRTKANYSYEFIYPREVLFTFPAFFGTWGIMAFYEHANRMEINFYIGIAVYAIFSIVITFIFINNYIRKASYVTIQLMKQDGIRMVIIDFSMLFFGFIVYYFEEVWRHIRVINESTPNNIFPTIILWGFVAFVVFVTIAVFGLIKRYHSKSDDDNDDNP